MNGRAWAKGREALTREPSGLARVTIAAMVSQPEPQGYLELAEEAMAIVPDAIVLATDPLDRDHELFWAGYVDAYARRRAIEAGRFAPIEVAKVEFRIVRSDD